MSRPNQSAEAKFASLPRRTVMSENSPSPGRRGFLALSAAVGAFSQPLVHAAAAAEHNAIRPFRIDVPEEAIVDLRRRVAATRWPDRETVNDRSQGVQLAKVQELVHYWGTEYDWRKAEARLNALPQFITTIDDVDIHFVHVRSRSEERRVGKECRSR